MFTILLRMGEQGRSTPIYTPIPTPSDKRTQKLSKTLVFPLFNSIITDGPMDQRTNGRTDGQSLELRVRN